MKWIETLHTLVKVGNRKRIGFHLQKARSWKNFIDSSMPSRICCCGVLFTNKGSFKYHVTTKHIAYRRLNMLKYCKTVDSNSSRAQTPGGMPTSSVVVASSSAATCKRFTIPLEPITIEDKRPMTIDVSTIKELNAEQTEYLVLEHASKLREIFEGKKYCRRHEDYKKGGKTRGDLAFQVHFGPFSEEQQDKIMEVLTNMFCCRHSEYFDYVSKVLLPETLVLVYMKVERKKREEAELLLLEGHEALDNSPQSSWSVYQEAVRTSPPG